MQEMFGDGGSVQFVYINKRFGKSKYSMVMDRRNIGVGIRWHLVHLLVPDPNVAANHRDLWKLRPQDTGGEGGYELRRRIIEWMHKIIKMEKK